MCTMSLSLSAMFGKIKKDETVSITYKLATAGSKAWQQLGDVVLKQPAAQVAGTVVDTVYAALPSKPLFALDTFDLAIKSRFKVYLKTAGIQVTVGGGLELVPGSGRFPTGSNGKAVFESTKNDGDGSKTYAVVAGRKDGKGAGVQKAPTDELLFTVKVRVKAGTKAGSGTVQITKLVELSDLGENPLTPSTTGVLESRDGVVDNKPARVYFQDDSIVGLYGYVDGASEVLNTAVISKTTIKIPIKVVAVHVRKTSTPNDAKCSTHDTSAMAVKECVVELSGAETRGARQAKVQVTLAKLSHNVSLHIFWPNKVSLASDLTTLRPVAGWLDETDSNCKALHYQRAYVTATASFADGGGAVISNYDVSGLVHLATNNTKITKITRVAAVSAIDGVSPGGSAVTISAVGVQNKLLATTQINIADEQAPLQLIGLDVVVLASLGAVSSTGKYGRNSNVSISVAAPVTRKLRFKGDAMDVVVTGVLSDQSRIDLDAKLGLVLSSNKNASIHVQGQKIVVPSEPAPADGALLNVKWQPTVGACKGKGQGVGKYAIHDTQVQVSPPAAQKLIATATKTFLVCKGDAASATGAGYPTTDQIAVSIQYPGRRVDSLASNKRTVYTVADGAPFTVDDSGKITANSKGAIGQGVVVVSFVGQNVTANVTVRVAKFKVLVARATPHPAYTGSSNEDAHKLASYECASNPTKYQQAQLVVTMQLTNNQGKSIDSKYVKFNTSSSIIQVSTGGRVTASKVGKVYLALDVCVPYALCSVYM